MLREALSSLDSRTQDFFRTRRNRQLDSFFMALTPLGSSYFGVFLLGVSWVIAEPVFWTAAPGFVVAWTTLFSLKSLVGRPRPGEPVLPEPADSSFPSSHTGISFYMAGALSLHAPELSFLLLPTAFGVAFSRLYFRMHHASDVIAGAVIGLAALLV